MEQEHEETIAEIMAGMECPKDFKCYKSQFANLGEAKSMGIKGFIQCLNVPVECDFSFSFGNIYMCKCPLRVYLANTLEM